MMDRFDSAKIKNADPFIGTIGDELDRVEAKAGKIGMNSAEQAFSILHKLDEIHMRMATIANEQSRRVVETQFEVITTKISKEASAFIRDLGGTGALRKERARVAPSEDRWWWFLDSILAERRKKSFNRGMVSLGTVLVALLVLAGIYQIFLAPDPAVAARYAHEQSARDLMMQGDLQTALEEVDKGLQYAPLDPVLLIIRGVILESLGRDTEAQQAMNQAAKGLESREEFLVTRGQAYSMVGELEKAAVDAAEAIALNPDFAQGHLLAGQVNEMEKNYQQALVDYENAYAAAEKSRQFQMAALARTRMAMLMQVFNAQIDFPDITPEE
jgi:tetratricopeptide (TPR) repeat protein